MYVLTLSSGVTKFQAAVRGRYSRIATKKRKKILAQHRLRGGSVARIQSVYRGYRYLTYVPYSPSPSLLFSSLLFKWLTFTSLVVSLSVCYYLHNSIQIMSYRFCFYHFHLDLTLIFNVLLYPPPVLTCTHTLTRNCTPLPGLDSSPLSWGDLCTRVTYSALSEVM